MKGFYTQRRASGQRSTSCNCVRTVYYKNKKLEFYELEQMDLMGWNVNTGNSKCWLQRRIQSAGVPHSLPLASHYPSSLISWPFVLFSPGICLPLTCTHLSLARLCPTPTYLRVFSPALESVWRRDPIQYVACPSPSEMLPDLSRYCSILMCLILMEWSLIS